MKNLKLNDVVTFDGYRGQEIVKEIGLIVGVLPYWLEVEYFVLGVKRTLKVPNGKTHILKLVEPNSNSVEFLDEKSFVFTDYNGTEFCGSVRLFNDGRNDEAIEVEWSQEVPTEWERAIKEVEKAFHEQ
jgi:hypothetical protein